MPSPLNARSCSAAPLTQQLLLLLLLVPCGGLGAPVQNDTGEIQAGDTSGEDEGAALVPSDLLASPVWSLIIGAAARHQKEFENEFHHGVKYYFLDNYKFSSLPATCPKFNLSKEACLHRLADGLSTYMLLFKHVEREYPNSSILLEVRPYSVRLLGLIKEKMRNQRPAADASGGREEPLLRALDNPSPFHRKMTAHCILRQLHDFLRDGRVALRRREKKAAEANRISPLSNTIMR